MGAVCDTTKDQKTNGSVIGTNADNIAHEKIVTKESNIPKADNVKNTFKNNNASTLKYSSSNIQKKTENSNLKNASGKFESFPVTNKSALPNQKSVLKSHVSHMHNTINNNNLASVKNSMQSNILESNIQNSNAVLNSQVQNSVFQSNLRNTGNVGSVLASTNNIGGTQLVSQIAGSQMVNPIQSSLAATKLGGTQLAENLESVHATNMVKSTHPSRIESTQLGGTHLAATQLGKTQLAGNKLASTQLAKTQLGNTKLASTQLAKTQLANTHLGKTTLKSKMAVSNTNHNLKNTALKSNIETSNANNIIASNLNNNNLHTTNLKNTALNNNIIASNINNNLVASNLRTTTLEFVDLPKSNIKNTTLKSNSPQACKSKIPGNDVNPELMETDLILMDAIKSPSKSKLANNYKKSIHNKKLEEKKSIPKSAISKKACESQFPMPKESIVNKSKIPHEVKNTLRPNQKLNTNSFIPGQVRSMIDIDMSQAQNFVENPFASNNLGYGNSIIPNQSGLVYSIANK